MSFSRKHRARRAQFDETIALCDRIIASCEIQQILLDLKSEMTIACAIEGSLRVERSGQ